jgi:hypothetical protein
LHHFLIYVAQPEDWLKLKRRAWPQLTSMTEDS